ncbi:hypothetical protein RM780_20625 [Streptomyces sp. DSM 44917]|uniref:Serine/threonine protein kinase n=1 Tax=Streptomyces boetiae TaxID=3075541 RepID=A0ABU2LCN9_9ACTN|nr:hypothetical protein [Streptomyces sp. DSM 44917]MDT0309346.1 hypothetical protein [Streptomyces sp. DSM 44917]
MRITKTRARSFLAGAVAAAGLVALASPPAQAAASWSASYGELPGEGLYPEETSCSGAYGQPDVPGGATRTAQYNGRTLTLRFYYHGDCGAFARVENAPQECSAHINRLEGNSIVWMRETVDPGLDYAYTMIANNLDGRQARAVLFCGDTALARTEWY